MTKWCSRCHDGIYDESEEFQVLCSDDEILDKSVKGLEGYASKGYGFCLCRDCAKMFFEFMRGTI